jgi:SAM-dependent methyltransferase
MEKIEHDEIRGAIRQQYGATARSGGCGCGCGPSSGMESARDMALAVGYGEQELAGLPEGANMGLGCGNPLAVAGLLPGQTVVDLGSGGGFDCFLAARKVGPTGMVIGVDMTPEMVEKARRNAVKAEVTNVEFRLGEIEHLPVADGVADWVISNCVINLSPDKQRVFSEAYRILKPGGRLSVADILALAEMPEALANDIALRAACVSGAERSERITGMMLQAGFADVSVKLTAQSERLLAEMFPGLGLENLIASAVIEAVK